MRSGSMLSAVAALLAAVNLLDNWLLPRAYVVAGRG